MYKMSLKMQKKKLQKTFPDLRFLLDMPNRTKTVNEITKKYNQMTKHELSFIGENYFDIDPKANEK